MSETLKARVRTRICLWDTGWRVADASDLGEHVRMTKREISKLIDTVYRHCGQKDTVIFCDRITALGFYHAFRAGISFGKYDMVVPSSKWKIVEATHTAAKEFEQQFNEGLITQGEKYNKVVDAWSKCTDKIADEMMREISVRKDNVKVRDVEVSLEILGDEGQGYLLVMSPEGGFTADDWYATREEALRAACELFGVPVDAWRS